MITMRAVLSLRRNSSASVHNMTHQMHDPASTPTISIHAPARSFCATTAPTARNTGLKVRIVIGLVMVRMNAETLSPAAPLTEGGAVVLRHDGAHGQEHRAEG